MKHSLRILKLFLIITGFALQSCATYHRNNIQNGDLLFVESSTENLSGAISRVTKNDAQISFDHVALIETDGKKIEVLDTTPEMGSIKRPISNFIARNKNKRIVLYRLKNKYKNTIPAAISKANQMLGKPYNISYILNESSYYCSDFIERSFRDAHIFELKPMTFINPKTQQTDLYWQKFYSELNLVVPEGKLGCNPNGLSKSNKIQKIKIINSSSFK